MNGPCNSTLVDFDGLVCRDQEMLPYFDISTDPLRGNMQSSGAQFAVELWFKMEMIPPEGKSVLVANYENIN